MLISSAVSMDSYDIFFLFATIVVVLVLNSTMFIDIDIISGHMLLLVSLGRIQSI